MLVILILLLAACAAMLAPIWRWRVGKTWWPTVILMLWLLLLLGFLAIERIEAS